MDAEQRKDGGRWLLSLLLWIPLAAYWGFALKVCWGWFVVPLGVPRIGVWWAAGLVVVARLLTFDAETLRLDRGSDERLGITIAVGVFVPSVTLATGAIYHALAVA